MAYVLRLPPQIQERIKEYVVHFGEGDAQALADGVQKALNEIANDPTVGTIISPAYGRPVYRFEVEANDMKHNLQVAYSVDDNDQSITVSTFGVIPM